MATLKTSPITMKSKIEILYPIADTATQKPRQGKIISVGPLPLSPAHPN
jgi:hypothetical protein